MATQKKGKKVTKSKRASNKKVMSGRRAPKKKTVKKLIAKKKSGTSSGKTVGTAGRASGKQARKNSRREAPAFEKVRRSSSGAQSGDLQGLRDIEGADSESVSELITEGNAFEAGVVKGVEDAGDDQQREVHSHEVSEDDVPEEYQDKD
jgi:hypothetical protein